MDDQPPATPEQINATVRCLLIASPLMFVGTYLLAAVQGAKPRECLLIAAVGLIGCLGAAGLYKLRGSKMAGDAVWIQAILRLLSRR